MKRPHQFSTATICAIAAFGAILATTTTALAGTVLLPGNSTANGNRAVVIEGLNNAANGPSSFVANGTANTVDGPSGVILNGARNTVLSSGSQSVILNGTDNTVGSAHCLVGSGVNNAATGLRSAVFVGSTNTASGGNSLVASGFRNEATHSNACVVAGSDNSASGIASGVLSGVRGIASASYTVTSGGSDNVASSIYATAGGGLRNIASQRSSTVAGGESNEATGRAATVAGGHVNKASGLYSTVAGGRECTAGGIYSAAAGYKATTLAPSSYIWGTRVTAFPAARGSVIFTDGDQGNLRNATPVFISDTHTMIGVFKNGYKFYTDQLAGAGAELLPGATAWSVLSDRESKENFEQVDTVEVLRKVAEMPITTWNYKHDGDTRYLGVMAQDLYKSFGLGHNAKSINTLVADGVQMAAIQGLSKIVDEKEVRINELEKRLEKLERLLENAAE